MKFFQTRMPAALLMLAAAATQPATGSALLASALSVALHGGPHAHFVSVVADEGHVHLVLSHEEGAHRDHGRTPNHGDPAVGERDHVFHMTGDAAASATPRRVALDPVPPLATFASLPSAPVPTWSSRASPGPRARSSDLLRTVVLRL